MGQVYGYVYLTTCNLTGKKYIGHHKWSQEYTEDEYKLIPEAVRDIFYAQHGFKIFPIDKQYYGSGSDLLLDMDLLGRQHFTVEILDKADSREECVAKETYWINLFKESGANMYNLTTNGNTGFDTDEWPECKRQEYRARCREYALKHNSIANIGDCSGEHNGRYGKPVSQITRSRISNANRGRKQSVEERDMRRKAHLEKCPNIKPPDCTGRILINNGKENKSIYPEQLSQYPGWVRGRLSRRKPNE